MHKLKAKQSFPYPQSKTLMLCFCSMKVQLKSSNCKSQSYRSSVELLYDPKIFISFLILDFLGNQTKLKIPKPTKSNFQKVFPKTKAITLIGARKAKIQNYQTLKIKPTRKVRDRDFIEKIRDRDLIWNGEETLREREKTVGTEEEEETSSDRALMRKRRNFLLKRTSV